MVVSAYKDGQKASSCTTDKNGKCFLDGLLIDTPYLVKAEGDLRYAAQRYRWTYQSSKATPVVAKPYSQLAEAYFNLPASQFIDGSIYVNSSSQPLTGAVVKLFEAGSPVAQSTTADKAGHYRFTGIAPGDYYVCAAPPASSEGLALTCFSNASSLTASRVVKVTEHPEYGINISLQKGGSIAGALTDQDNLKLAGWLLEAVQDLPTNPSPGTQADSIAPLPEVMIGLPVQSQFNGSYTLQGVPAGSFKIRATPPQDSGENHYLALYYGGTVLFDSAAPVSVTVGQATTGVDIVTSARSGQIGGVVCDQDGAALPGVTVRAFDAATGSLVAASAVSDATGSYVLAGLPVGSYLVRAAAEEINCIDQYYNRADGRAKATPVAVTAGQTAPGIDFRLVPLVIGDINANGRVDLHDAIEAMQIISGIPISTRISKKAAQDPAGRIGLGDAIHILQENAGLTK